MFKANYFNQTSPVSHARNLLILLLAFATLSLAGCGSTKVYTANKTIVHRDNLYNVTDVQQISSKVEAILPGGEVKDMANMDKKAVTALLKESSPLTVTMFINLDEKEMVYQRQEVKKYSQYSKMSKNLSKAMSNITKSMAKGTSTQLKLK